MTSNSELDLYPNMMIKDEEQQYKIRRAIKQDNPQIASIIRSVMSEYGATSSGFAIHDPEVDQMFETYSKPRSSLYVIEHEGKLVGCCGVAPLKGEENSTCEIQKMYFLKDARGKGLGEKALIKLLEDAKSFGYSKSYLETTSNMKEAHKLYEKVGFKKRNSSLGCTGHFACEVWYEREL